MTLPFALIGAGLLTVVASFTRSYKEAQSWLGVVMLVPTVPIAIASVLSVQPSASLMLVPSLSQHLVIQGLMRGEPLSASWVLLSVASSLLLAWLLGWLAGSALSTRGDTRLIIRNLRRDGDVELLMNRPHQVSMLALALLVIAPLSSAQIETVPMKGLGNEWVKKLELRGRSDWEWLETYPGAGLFCDPLRFRAQWRHRDDVAAYRVQESAESWRTQERHEP